MGCKLDKNENPTSEMKNKRQIEHVPEPIKSILKIDDLFDNANNRNEPNLLKLKRHLEGEGRLSADLTIKIIEMTNQLLKVEPNVLHICSPVNVVGDIHGQFYDLLTIFTLSGSPSACKYLFMGDFVDRGLFAFECVCYLYCLKIKYPDRVFLLRGNHESRHLTRFFTFRDECLIKGSELVYEKFMVSFDSLPIAAVLDEKFCNNELIL
jgi:serine/threonine-protein phosphatase 2B catalytic subunit